MKQIVQNYRTGALYLETVPAPQCRAGSVLVRTVYSLVSSGTERMKVDQARMGLIAKARARPDKVRQVLQSVRQVGLAETINKVRERLDALTPLGYSLSGMVEAVGAGVDDLRVGDRVACAGEGVAMHAEFVAVPRNLCVKIPDGVNMQDAAFSTVGAISLNGVRQAGVTLGDSVGVIGLGLVGLLAVQILKAAGCRVIGIDVDPAKLELARQCGAELALLRNDPGLKAAIEQATRGVGVDCAYVAASTSSSDPLDLAGELLRDRGRVVIVGMVPVRADWQTYYGKELSVVMSRSYGPGRYDPAYEQQGLDYPIGYVRWTENRNIEEFIRLLAAGSVGPSRLSPSVFKFADAPRAYQELHESPGKHAVGMLFEYPTDARPDCDVVLPRPSLQVRHTTGEVAIGMIGAGNFATATLIPAFKKVPGVRLAAICSAGGLSAASAAKRHGFESCSSDHRRLLDDPKIDAVIIATRHDTHARIVCDALRAGKHVFVEKPLALNREQLEEIIEAQRSAARIVMPGFNRRFSPLSSAVRAFFANRNSPIEVVCRVNAGAIKSDSWYQDPDIGGWRLVSEGCHFVDLIQYLCGAAPIRAHAEMIGGGIPGGQNDNCSALLRMADGSVATLIYVANGDPSVAKERIEVFGQGRTGIIDNWHSAQMTANGKTKKLRGRGKGHAEEAAAFIDAIRKGSDAALPFDEAVATTLTTFAIVESLVTELPVSRARREVVLARPHPPATRNGDEVESVDSQDAATIAGRNGGPH